MKANGKHETSRSWLRAAKRDNKIAALFAGLDRAVEKADPIHDLAKKPIHQPPKKKGAE